MPEDRGAATSGQVQSLVRALGALEELARHASGLSLTQLSRRIDLPRSTTHRLLTTMNGLRFVLFDPQTNHWMVGPQAFTVGAAFGGARDLARLGRPFIRALNMKSDETVNLLVPNEQEMVYVGQQRSKSATPMPFETGDRLPIHLAAAGKAVLAFQREEELDAHLRKVDFTRRTNRSLASARDLAESLRQVRGRGYAFDQEESAQQLHCVGAPVFDAQGQPVAALSISGPDTRMGRERMHALGRELRATALKLTNSLGGQAPDVLYA